MKVGKCLLIRPKDKWLCVKYYSHDDESLYYVPMPIDMLTIHQAPYYHFPNIRYTKIHSHTICCIC